MEEEFSSCSFDTIIEELLAEWETQPEICCDEDPFFPPYRRFIVASTDLCHVAEVFATDDNGTLAPDEESKIECFTKNFRGDIYMLINNFLVNTEKYFKKIGLFGSITASLIPIVKQLIGETQTDDVATKVIQSLYIACWLLKLESVARHIERRMLLLTKKFIDSLYPLYHIIWADENENSVLNTAFLNSLRECFKKEKFIQLPGLLEKTSMHHLGAMIVAQRHQPLSATADSFVKLARSIKPIVRQTNLKWPPKSADEKHQFYADLLQVLDLFKPGTAKGMKSFDWVKFYELSSRVEESKPLASLREMTQILADMFGNFFDEFLTDQSQDYFEQYAPRFGFTYSYNELLMPFLLIPFGSRGKQPSNYPIFVQHVVNQCCSLPSTAFANTQTMLLRMIPKKCDWKQIKFDLPGPQIERIRNTDINWTPLLATFEKGDLIASMNASANNNKKKTGPKTLDSMTPNDVTYTLHYLRKSKNIWEPTGHELKLENGTIDFPKDTLSFVQRDSSIRHVRFAKREAAIEGSFSTPIHRDILLRALNQHRYGGLGNGGQNARFTVGQLSTASGEFEYGDPFTVTGDEPEPQKEFDEDADYMPTDRQTREKAARALQNMAALDPGASASNPNAQRVAAPSVEAQIRDAVDQFEARTGFQCDPACDPPPCCPPPCEPIPPCCPKQSGDRKSVGDRAQHNHHHHKQQQHNHSNRFHSFQ